MHISKVEHKKAVVFLVMILGMVLYLSSSPDFTGSVISDESGEQENIIADALADSKIGTSFIFGSDFFILFALIILIFVASLCLLSRRKNKSKGKGKR
jgi:hypothetical protein